MLTALVIAGVLGLGFLAPVAPVGSTATHPAAQGAVVQAGHTWYVAVEYPADSLGVRTGSNSEEYESGVDSLAVQFDPAAQFRPYVYSATLYTNADDEKMVRVVYGLSLPEGLEAGTYTVPVTLFNHDSATEQTTDLSFSVTE